MDPIEKRQLKRQAWMRLAAQRHRAGLLRGRVVVLSLICFAVLWGVVFAQMATGNDPVLSAKATAAATRAAGSARSEVETTDSRELERERAAKRAKARADEEATEAEPEFEEAETEPLVTSQS
jgi:cytoskeletal protein RodZ